MHGVKRVTALQIEFCQKDDGGELWTPGIMWIRDVQRRHIKGSMVVNGFNECLLQRSTCYLYWFRACEPNINVPNVYNHMQCQS